MIISAFEYGSLQYQQSLLLRQQILRTPLGLTLSEQDLAGEAEQFHFGVFLNDKPLACVLLKPCSDSELKLRQMAVATELQGQGMGHQLVQFAELEAQAKGYTLISMAARVSAVGFYQKLGYQCQGQTFQQAGIAHITMSKNI